MANPDDELGIRQHGMRVSSGCPASTRSASFHCEEQDSRVISQEKLTITTCFYLPRGVCLQLLKDLLRWCSTG